MLSPELSQWYENPYSNPNVLKDSGSAELINAIEIVMGGESYIQPDMIPMLNSKMISRNSDKGKGKPLFKSEWISMLPQIILTLSFIIAKPKWCILQNSSLLHPMPSSSIETL